MTWVKQTLPPRLRARWLLMTTRLSMSSLAGMARTLVAVGTCRLASMLVTTRAAAPLSGCVSASLGTGGAARVGLDRARRPRRRSVPPGGSRAGGGGGLADRRGRRLADARGLRFAWPRRRRPPPGRDRQAGSRRRSPTRPGLPSSGPSGTAGRSRRRAIRWGRSQLSDCWTVTD